MSYPVFASNVPAAEGKCPTFADSRSDFVPTVSVIIPVRNRSEVIVRCLQSVAAQTYERVRLIVVDNGSTDDTRSRVADWMSANAGRFVETCLLDEPRSGANAARNQGLRAVSDGYVAFFDSDDEMSPDFLTQMLATLCKDAAAQWVLARTPHDLSRRHRAGAPRRAPPFGGAPLVERASFHPIFRSRGKFVASGRRLGRNAHLLARLRAGLPTSSRGAASRLVLFGVSPHLSHATQHHRRIAFGECGRNCACAAQTGRTSRESPPFPAAYA